MSLKSRFQYTALVIVACSIVAPQAEAQSSGPLVECKIKNCLKSNNGSNGSTVCDVANGNYIDLTIHIKGVGGVPAKQLGPNMVNPTPAPSPGIYYLVKAIRQSDGAEVPVRVFDRGGSGGPKELTDEVSLEIPEAPAARQAKLQAYWNKVKANANPKDQITLQQTRLKDEDILKTLDHYLTENQTGQFKIICGYVSTKPGTWNGEADSAPIIVNVVDKGTLLTKPLQ